jgi:hypothetical protein
MATYRRLNLSLDMEIHDWLVSESERCGVPIAEVIRRLALAEKVRREERSR